MSQLLGKFLMPCLLLSLFLVKVSMDLRFEVWRRYFSAWCLVEVSTATLSGPCRQLLIHVFIHWLSHFFFHSGKMFIEYYMPGTMLRAGENFTSWYHRTWVWGAEKKQVPALDACWFWNLHSLQCLRPWISVPVISSLVFLIWVSLWDITFFVYVCFGLDISTLSHTSESDRFLHLWLSRLWAISFLIRSTIYCVYIYISRWYYSTPPNRPKL